VISKAANIMSLGPKVCIYEQICIENKQVGVVFKYNFTSLPFCFKMFVTRLYKFKPICNVPISPRQINTNQRCKRRLVSRSNHQV